MLNQDTIDQGTINQSLVARIKPRAQNSQRKETQTKTQAKKSHRV
tara:strand:- start:362 stop:496 length:135 start_codon:yes stop_codon:yes gene_type:complete